MSKFLRGFLAVIGILVGYATNSFAVGSGALGNQTVHTKAASQGFAFAGVADDPSAIFYNPGGLTQVKGLQYVLGGALIDFSAEHTSTAGVTDEMDKNRGVIPNFYISYSGSDSPWAFGLGLNTPFGLLTEWKDGSFSEAYATESKVLMYNLNPTVSYAPSDSLSFGVGLNYMNFHDVELNQRVTNLSFALAPTGFGRSKLSGDGTGWGYNLGMLWKPVERHSFGVSYRSQVNIVVEGDVNITGLTGATAFGFGGSSFKSDADTVLKMPQSVLLGYGFRPNDRWTIFFDYEWVNWSVSDQTKINYSNNNANLPGPIARDWKSTNNVGLGTEWKANDRFDLRGGVGAYERVIPSGTLESQIPSASRWFLTLGTGIHMGNTTVDLGYNAIFFNDRTVNNNQGNAFANLDGKYESFIGAYYASLSQKWGGN